MRYGRKAQIEASIVRRRVEDYAREQGRVGVTDEQLERVISGHDARVILAVRRFLSVGLILVPIRPPTGGRPVAWMHRDHATREEREAEEQRRKPAALGEPLFRHGRDCE